jgi:hypothetical protein
MDNVARDVMECLACRCRLIAAAALRCDLAHMAHKNRGALAAVERPDRVHPDHGSVIA